MRDTKRTQKPTGKHEAPVLSAQQKTELNELLAHMEDANRFNAKMNMLWIEFAKELTNDAKHNRQLLVAMFQKFSSNVDRINAVLCQRTGKKKEFAPVVKIRERRMYERA